MVNILTEKYVNLSRERARERGRGGGFWESFNFLTTINNNINQSVRLDKGKLRSRGFRLCQGNKV